MTSISPMLRVFAVGAMAMMVAGCSYDYMQHTDRVGYSAGNAVKANLEAQTTNPSKPSSYRTRDLGKNGYVIPDTGKVTEEP